MCSTTCSGELYVYYDGDWLGISDATGPQGPQGDQGPQGPGGLQGEQVNRVTGAEQGEPGEHGEKGALVTLVTKVTSATLLAADPEVGDWWFDTKCPSQQYFGMVPNGLVLLHLVLLDLKVKQW